MMTAIELRYPEPEVQDYLGSPERCGFHQTIIRSTDGGKTWGDPTLMHQYVAETSLAILADQRNDLWLILKIIGRRDQKL